MAKIANTKGRSDANSGYSRLFGNQKLGQLISRVHATVIRSGNELERVIEHEVSADLKSTLDNVLNYRGGFEQNMLQVVFQAKMPGSSGSVGGTVDIAIFDHNKEQVILIELKDGDTFDTKKSSGELANMIKFSNWISGKSNYKAIYYFCSFNQDDKEAIIRGAKGRFDLSHAMTGRELCNILGIGYDRLRTKREAQQQENLVYFLNELISIQEIREFLKKFLIQKG